MPRKTREDAAVVRDRVERAAMRLFALHGSSAVSVQAIADAVGMSKQAVLYHYGNKEAIRGAVLQRVTGRAQAWVEEFTADGTELSLATLTDRVFEAYLADPFIPGVILREVLEDPDQGGSTIQEGTLPWRERVQELLEAAQRAGVVRPDLDTERWFDRVALMLLSSLALPPREAAPPTDPEDADAIRAVIAETIRIALVSSLADPATLL